LSLASSSLPPGLKQCRHIVPQIAKPTILA
jgi:hypothetical protein